MMSKKLKDATHAIEKANNCSNDEFISWYLKPTDGWTSWTHPKNDTKYSMGLYSAADLTKDDLDACFNLIDLTSGKDYRSSSLGWHPAAKRKEMLSPDLRYTLVKSDEDQQVKGFSSIMPTFENGEPVVYCYEIHLDPELQGTGLGKLLLHDMIRLAGNISGVEKVMLTCFVSNKLGRAFYDKMHFEVDDYSPRERKLRGGKVVVPDFVILSKRITKAARGNEKITQQQVDIDKKGDSSEG